MCLSPRQHESLGHRDQVLLFPHGAWNRALSIIDYAVSVCGSSKIRDPKSRSQLGTCRVQSQLRLPGGGHVNRGAHDPSDYMAIALSSGFSWDNPQFLNVGKNVLFSFYIGVQAK